MQANECMNKYKNRQSTGATEPRCAYWMARPGTQKWAAKDEWGSHTESHTQQEPRTLADAPKGIDLRSGVGGGRIRRDLSKQGAPASVCPRGLAPTYPASLCSPHARWASRSWRTLWEEKESGEAPFSEANITRKNLPAMQETWVQSLGWEDSPGEGNGNLLQYSCPENSMDRGSMELQRVGHD